MEAASLNYLISFQYILINLNMLNKSTILLHIDFFSNSAIFNRGNNKNERKTVKMNVRKQVFLFMDILLSVEPQIHTSLISHLKNWFLTAREKWYMYQYVTHFVPISYIV